MRTIGIAVEKSQRALATPSSQTCRLKNLKAFRLSIGRDNRLLVAGQQCGTALRRHDSIALHIVRNKHHAFENSTGLR